MLAGLDRGSRPATHMLANLGLAPALKTNATHETGYDATPTRWPVHEHPATALGPGKA